MKKLITFSFIPKRYIELLITIIITLVAAMYFNKMVNTTSLRWTFYVFISPFILWLLFAMKNSTYKLAALMFTLIFVDSLINRTGPSGLFKLHFSLIFALTILSSFLHFKQEKWNLGSFKHLFILFLFTAVVSMIIANFKNPQLIIDNVNFFQTYYLEFFLFFCLGFLAFNNALDIKKFFFIMLFFGGLVATTHIYSISAGVNIEMIRGPQAVLSRRNLSAVGGSVWRYGSFFGNPNTMGVFYAMFIPVGILLIFSETMFLKRILAAGLIMIMGMSLLFAGSRGGLIFTLVNSVLALFFMNKKWQAIMPGILVLLLTFYLTHKIFSVYFLDFFTRSMDLFSEKGWVLGRRLTSWHCGIKVIIDNLLGIGLSAYNYAPLAREHVSIVKLPHNIYLEMALQTGVCGLIMFLTIVVKSIVLNIKAYLKTKDLNSKEALSLLFLPIIGFLLCGIVEPIFINQFKLNHIFGLILGISVSFSYRLLRKSKEENSAPFLRED